MATCPHSSGVFFYLSLTTLLAVSQVILSLFDHSTLGRLSPDADKVVAVQAVVHINAVAVEMEMKDAGFAVRMERDDVLEFGEVSGKPVTLFVKNHGYFKN